MKAKSTILKSKHKDADMELSNTLLKAERRQAKNYVAQLLEKYENDLEGMAEKQLLRQRAKMDAVEDSSVETRKVENAEPNEKEISGVDRDVEQVEYVQESPVSWFRGLQQNKGWTDDDICDQFDVLDQRGDGLLKMDDVVGCLWNLESSDKEPVTLEMQRLLKSSSVSKNGSIRIDIEKFLASMDIQRSTAWRKDALQSKWETRSNSSVEADRIEKKSYNKTHTSDSDKEYNASSSAAEYLDTEAIRKENQQWNKELQSIGLSGGIEGLKKFKEFVVKQASDLRYAVVRIRELEKTCRNLREKFDMGTDVGARRINLDKVGQGNKMENQPSRVNVIPSSPKQISADFEGSSVIAFHERKLLWATRELGHCGVQNMLKWFSKMDSENSGYLTSQLISMALQESGGAVLTDAEIVNITCGMNHDAQNRINYNELIEVMQSILQMKPSTTSSTSNTKAKFPNDTLASIRAQMVRISPFDQIPTSLRRPFHKRDPTAEGTMTKATFCAAIDELGVVLSENELQHILEKYDPRNSGVVTYSKLIQDLLSPNRNTRTDEAKVDTGRFSSTLNLALNRCVSSSYGMKSMLSLHSKCRRIDENGSGYLSRQEFRDELVHALKLDLSAADMHQLMDSLDNNSEGKVSYQDFFDTVVVHSSDQNRDTQKQSIPKSRDSYALKSIKTMLRDHVKSATKKRLTQQLERYDENLTGLVSLESFQKVLSIYGRYPLTIPETKTLCNAFSEDSYIKYEEILRFIFDDDEFASHDDDRYYSEPTHSEKSRSGRPFSQIKSSLQRFLQQDYNGRRIQPATLRKKCREYDFREKGTLGVEDLLSILKGIGPITLKKLDLEQVCKVVNRKFNGTIKYDDFINYIFGLIAEYESDDFSTKDTFRKLSISSSDDDNMHEKRRSDRKHKNASYNSVTDSESDGASTILRKNDFLQLIRKHVGPSMTKRKLALHFRKSDVEDSGYLDEFDFREALDSFGRLQLRNTTFKDMSRALSVKNQRKQFAYDKIVADIFRLPINDGVDSNCVERFRLACKEYVSPKSSRNEMESFFSTFEPNSRNALSKSEFVDGIKQALRYDQFTNTECNRIFREIDSAHKNRIDAVQLGIFLKPNQSGHEDSDDSDTPTLRNKRDLAKTETKGSLPREFKEIVKLVQSNAKEEDINLVKQIEKKGDDNGTISKRHLSKILTEFTDDGDADTLGDFIAWLGRTNHGHRVDVLEVCELFKGTSTKRKTSDEAGNENVYEKIMEYIRPENGTGKAALMDKFRLLDRDDKGYIDREDMIRIGKRVGSKRLSDAKADTILRKLLSTSGSTSRSTKTINFATFREIVANTDLSVLGKSSKNATHHELSHFEKEFRSWCLEMSNSESTINVPECFSVLDRHDIDRVSYSDILAALKDNNISATKTQVLKLLTIMGVDDDDPVLTQKIFASWAAPTSSFVKKVTTKIKRAIALRSNASTGKPTSSKQVIKSMLCGKSDKLTIAQTNSILQSLHILSKDEKIEPVLHHFGISSRKPIDFTAFMLQSSAT